MIILNNINFQHVTASRLVLLGGLCWLAVQSLGSPALDQQKKSTFVCRFGILEFFTVNQQYWTRKSSIVTLEATNFSSSPYIMERFSSLHLFLLNLFLLMIFCFHFLANLLWKFFFLSIDYIEESNKKIEAGIDFHLFFRHFSHIRNLWRHHKNNLYVTIKPPTNHPVFLFYRHVLV